ncbi:MAG: hypothetical protein ACJ71W_17485 [Terriglobales bacterium]
MSEQNILNPTAASQLNPTYSIPHKDPAINSNWQPRSGKPYSRTMMARGMEFQFQWKAVQYSTYEALLQWFHQYEKDFFSYFNFQRNRYFSGQFLAEPQLEELGNNQFNISATFVETPTLPMFQYPSAWGVSSIFIEERDGFGQDLVKYTGAGWTIHNADANAHGGFNSFDSTTNDTAEIIYVGYGFRYWAQKASFQGIIEISLDGTVVGTVDLYNATTVASAALFTNQNVSLGLHRVKLRVTGTKNASSSGFLCLYDAIEVMR